MAERNNLKDITGVIYAKPIKKVTAKKGPNKGQEVEIPSLVLEIRGNGNGIDYIDFHEFSIGNKSIPMDDFAIGDPVVITYALGGVKWNDGFINRTKAIYIKHADVDYNDTTDLRAQKPTKVKEEVFTGAVPETDEPDELNDLPF
jgi:hypothetical protein